MASKVTPPGKIEDKRINNGIEIHELLRRKLNFFQELHRHQVACNQEWKKLDAIGWDACHGCDSVRILLQPFNASHVLGKLIHFRRITFELFEALHRLSYCNCFNKPFAFYNEDFS